MDGVVAFLAVFPELKFVLAVMFCALLIEGPCASPAGAMTHTVEFTCPVDPAVVASIGVMWDGVPATSGVPKAPDSSGVWRLPTHVAYGHNIQVVVIDVDGLVSPASNVQVYGGCLWDRDANGVIGGSDFSRYLVEIGALTATPAEFDSFKSSFGMRCPQ